MSVKKEEYLEMPWSMEDTIENLCVLKKAFQEKVIDINLDGKGEQDEKEVAFDFDRAIEALEKQIPKKPKEQGTDEKTHYKCPECGWIPLTIYSDGYHLGNKPKYCERCGQAIDWNEVD